MSIIPFDGSSVVAWVEVLRIDDGVPRVLAEEGFSDEAVEVARADGEDELVGGKLALALERDFLCF